MHSLPLTKSLGRPWYPCLQSHSYPPQVLVHVACSSQSWKPSAHSSRSLTNTRVKLSSKLLNDTWSQYLQSVSWQTPLGKHLAHLTTSRSPSLGLVEYHFDLATGKGFVWAHTCLKHLILNTGPTTFFLPTGSNNIIGTTY